MIGAYETDGGAGARARLGLVVLQTDETLEGEFRSALTAGDVGLFHTRIPAHADVTPETLLQMEAVLPRSAALLPGELDVVAYGCTSASTIIGSERVAALVKRSHPGAAVTDPIQAVIAALRHLGAARIGLVTPYVAQVTAPIRAHLAHSGIATASEISFAQKEDWTVARITEASTQAAMLQVAQSGQVDAIFASCTNLRSFGIIDDVEAATGVPVVTSNQALLWHMLTLADQPTRGVGPGRLFHS